jgi:glycosyltransferase involved in cell wall biosynthesis
MTLLRRLGLVKAPPRPNITVAVIAQDRARELAGLLKNVERFACEVVVVDGGSKDDTESVARAHPLVRYVHRAWDGHFGRQKNAAIGEARGDWVLHLDTDERVGARLAERLPELCASRWRQAYRIPMYWLVSESPLRFVRTKKHYPSWCPRLFRNDERFRYVEDRSPVHVAFPKHVVRSMKKIQGAHLLHYCLAWLSKDELRAKAERYARDEPGSEHTNRAYYLWWEQPHEVLPCDEPPL